MFVYSVVPKYDGGEIPISSKYWTAAGGFPQLPFHRIRKLSKYLQVCDIVLLTTNFLRRTPRNKPESEGTALGFLPLA